MTSYEPLDVEEDLIEKKNEDDNKEMKFWEKVYIFFLFASFIILFIVMYRVYEHYEKNPYDGNSCVCATSNYTIVEINNSSYTIEYSAYCVENGIYAPNRISYGAYETYDQAYVWEMINMGKTLDCCVNSKDQVSTDVCPFNDGYNYFNGYVPFWVAIGGVINFILIGCMYRPAKSFAKSCGCST
jgi:hypothetical protein